MSIKEKDFYNSGASFSVSGKDVEFKSNKTSTSSDNEINTLVQSIGNKFNIQTYLNEEDIDNEISKDMQNSAKEILHQIQKQKNDSSNNIFDSNKEILRSDNSVNLDKNDKNNVNNVEIIEISASLLYEPLFTDKLLKFIKRLSEGTEIKSKKIYSAFKESDINKKAEKIKKILTKINKNLDNESKIILNTYIKGLIIDVDSSKNNINDKKLIIKKKSSSDINKNNFQQELITFSQQYDSDRFIGGKIDNGKNVLELQNINNKNKNTTKGIGIEIKIDNYDKVNLIENEINNYSIKQNIDFVKKFNMNSKNNVRNKSKASSKFSDKTKYIEGSDKQSNETSTKKNSDFSNKSIQNNVSSNNFKNKLGNNLALNQNHHTGQLKIDKRSDTFNLMNNNYNEKFNTHQLTPKINFDIIYNNDNNNNKMLNFEDQFLNRINSDTPRSFSSYNNYNNSPSPNFNYPIHQYMYNSINYFSNNNFNSNSYYPTEGISMNNSNINDYYMNNYRKNLNFNNNSSFNSNISIFPNFNNSNMVKINENLMENMNVNQFNMENKKDEFKKKKKKFASSKSILNENSENNTIFNNLEIKAKPPKKKRVKNKKNKVNDEEENLNECLTIKEMLHYLTGEETNNFVTDLFFEAYNNQNNDKVSYQRYENLFKTLSEVYTEVIFNKMGSINLQKIIIYLNNDQFIELLEKTKTLFVIICKDQYSNRLLQNLFHSLKIRKNEIDVIQKDYDYFDNFEKSFILTIKDKLNEMIRTNPASYVISECLKSFDYKNCNHLHKALEENLLRLINDNKSVNIIKTLMTLSLTNKMIKKMITKCLKENFAVIAMNKSGHYILISYFEEISQEELNSYSDIIIKNIDFFLYKSFSYKVVRKFTKLLVRFLLNLGK